MFSTAFVTLHVFLEWLHVLCFQVSKPCRFHHVQPAHENISTEVKSVNRLGKLCSGGLNSSNDSYRAIHGIVSREVTQGYSQNALHSSVKYKTNVLETSLGQYCVRGLKMINCENRPKHQYIICQNIGYHVKVVFYRTSNFFVFSI